MTRPARSGFWAGLIAGALTVIAIYFGLFTGGVPAVALALWERQMRLIPLFLFSILIVRLKFAAKPAAFWGMLAVLVVLLGVLGFILARLRTRLLGVAVAAWIVVSGALAALTWGPASGYLEARRAAEGASGGSSTVAAAIAAYGAMFALLYAVLLWVAQRRGPKAPPGQIPPAGITRREMLSRAVVIVAASAAGTSAAQWIGTMARRAAAAAQSSFARVKNLPPEITSNDQFYVVSKNPPGFDPVVEVSKWSLQVTGLVPQPLRLTYDELKQIPSVEQFQTLECISNEVGGDLVSNAKWRGVRLRDVLLRAGGPSPKAVKVAVRCADGYSESIPVGDAMNPTTLLVYEMNGEPLPAKHGFPLRLLIPGLYGMKNPKWITRIEVVDIDFQGYWEASGWTDDAVVKAMSKFSTVPRTQPMEDVALGGVAFAGDRGVKDVEYSTDGGKTWLKAELKPPLGQFTWVLWAAIWKPSGPGEYTLKVRAKDGGGVLQTAKEAPTLPDGASGYHTLRVRVRK